MVPFALVNKGQVRKRARPLPESVHWLASTGPSRKGPPPTRLQQAQATDHDRNGQKLFHPAHRRQVDAPPPVDLPALRSPILLAAVRDVKIRRTRRFLHCRAVALSARLESRVRCMHSHGFPRVCSRNAPAGLCRWGGMFTTGAACPFDNSLRAGPSTGSGQAQHCRVSHATGCDRARQRRGDQFLSWRSTEES